MQQLKLYVVDRVKRYWVHPDQLRPGSWLDHFIKHSVQVFVLPYQLLVQRCQVLDLGPHLLQCKVICDLLGALRRFWSPRNSLGTLAAERGSIVEIFLRDAFLELVLHVALIVAYPDLGRLDVPDPFLVRPRSSGLVGLALVFRLDELICKVNGSFGGSPPGLAFLLFGGSPPGLVFLLWIGLPDHELISINLFEFCFVPPYAASFQLSELVHEILVHRWLLEVQEFRIRPRARGVSHLAVIVKGRLVHRNPWSLAVRIEWKHLPTLLLVGLHIRNHLILQLRMIFIRCDRVGLLSHFRTPWSVLHPLLLYLIRLVSLQEKLLVIIVLPTIENLWLNQVYVLHLRLFLLFEGIVVKSVNLFLLRRQWSFFLNRRHNNYFK